MENASFLNNIKQLSQSSLGTPILLLAMLAMMILPLPSIFLDILFTFNISLSIVVLLGCIYTRRPLEFSVFPTVLLVSTLMRLALNVASTRVVLLHGQQGTGAAGHVIQSFGEVVIGNNFAVGLVVFAILVIINFVVVTKGAGRISEVSARFTLDAMPGKQMAIDADLNAGVINQEEAKRRRAEVSEEADFYGAMDGASKFVRGDAIAGLLILFINVIGGIIIGVAQYRMSLGEASHTYAILTIGDGLVAQIPSLLLSTAAAIMVTRVNSAKDMGTQIFEQLFNHPRSLTVTGSIVGIMGLIPGMPHVSFLGIASIAIAGAYYIDKKNKAKAAMPIIEEKLEEPVEENEEFGWEDVQPVDVVGLEIGYRLINLVDKKQQGQLTSRIKGIRKKLSKELGFLIPSVHIRDNLQLAPNQYRITLMGVAVGEGTIEVNKELAINPGQVFGDIDGTKTKDPTFGLDAVWINPTQRDQAQSMGYTVVDPSTTIATHISQILQNYSSELLGHEEVQHLLDRLNESAPKLVEALTPNAMPLSTIVKILQSLLVEKIPIVDIRTIAESLIENASHSQNPDELVNQVRISLKRLVVQTINGNGKNITAVTLAPELEQILQQSIQMNDENHVGIEPSLADKIYGTLSQFSQQQENKSESAILLVSHAIRSQLAKFVRHSIPDLHVLSYNEIPDDKQVKIIGSIGN